MPSGQKSHHVDGQAYQSGEPPLRMVTRPSA